MGPIGGIVVVTLLSVVCATRGGLFPLLCLYVVCGTVFGEEWHVGPLSLDAGDIVVAMMAFLVVRGARPDQGLRLRDIPAIRLWIVLGLLMSAAYVSSPVNADRLADPVRISYQLYRYCWKPILLYPLVCLLVGRNSGRARSLLLLVLALGSYTALTTVGAYFLGNPTGDLIEQKNKFAGSLIAPTIACFALLLSVPGGNRRLALLAGFSVLGAGLVAAGSRGAIVAAGVAGAALVIGLARYAGGRRRLARLAGWGALALVLLVFFGPDISSLPGLRLIAELQQGAQVDNLVWRIQERWPYFWQKLLTSPWLGLGTDRDLSLATHANTPHNGYLSLALLRGIPAAVITVGFGVRAMWRARRGFRARGETRVRLLSLGVAAAIGGLLVHNLVESTLTLTNVGALYWMLVGLGTMAPALSTATASETKTVTPKRPRRRGGRIPVRPLLVTEDGPPH